MDSVRVPLFALPQQRQFSTTEDQWFKNCYPEVIAGPADTPFTSVIKRPGFSDSLTTATAAGRALYGWTQNGSIYAAVGNKIFKDGSALSGTLDDTTGRVDVTEVRGGTPRLVFRVADKIWTVAADNTMTKQTDADIPTGLVSGIVNIDGFICVMKGSTNQIFHADVNDPTSWNANSVLTSSLEPDLGVGIAKHLNFVVAFNEWSTEFFFNAGNASGSTLSPVEGIAIRYGCANGDTIFSGENTVIWLAQGRSGGKSVMMLEGNDLKTISTKPVERLIDEEANGGGNGIADAYAYGMRIAGHQFYILTLKNTAKTLVCDIRDGTWHEWTSFDGTTETYFTGMDFCEDADKKFLLDEDNGKIYNMDIDIHQDSTNDIKVEMLTSRIDFQSTKPKFLYRLGVIGDIQSSSSPITIDWSDDDYNNYATSRTVDMNNTFPRLVALGRFHRRAFRLAHTANTPLRLEGLEMGVEQGRYAEGDN